MSIALVLGSGGHTSELLQIVSNIPEVKACRNLSIFYSKDDCLSVAKCKSFFGDSLRSNAIYPIPRARRVGQSYFSSIFSTIYSFFAVLRIFLTLFSPKLIICNGPAINVSIVAASYFISIFSLGMLARPKVVYIESVARSRTLSLTGKIMLYLADSFLIQWPQLAKKYQHKSNVLYTGLLV